MPLKLQYFLTCIGMGGGKEQCDALIKDCAVCGKKGGVNGESGSELATGQYHTQLYQTAA